MKLLLGRYFIKLGRIHFDGSRQHDCVCSFNYKPDPYKYFFALL